MNLDRTAVIVHIIYEIIIATCTVIIAWPKIKRCFRREKKIFINKLYIIKNINLEHISIKNTIAWI